MKVRTIASGSKGNCTIILSENINLIIDMGISYLTLKKSLEENSLSFDNFDGILITHCHKDHIRGLSSLIKHTKLNVYIPESMYDSLKEHLPQERSIFIEDKFTLNDLTIELIHTSHDAPSSVGFIITSKNSSLVYITDTGYINRKYLPKISNKNVYVIESNHDEVMLMDGPYPRFLKERIISDIGHLSNNATAKYLTKIVGDNTKTILLAHISETNNTEELALRTIKESLKDTDITILAARQDESSLMIEV